MRVTFDTPGAARKDLSNLDPAARSAARLAKASVFDVTEYPYNAVPGDPDVSAAIQRALDDAEAFAKNSTLPSGILGTGGVGTAVVHIPQSALPYMAAGLIIGSGVNLIIDGELQAPLGSNRTVVRSRSADARFGKGLAGTGEITHDFSITGRGWINGNAGFLPGYTGGGKNYNTVGDGIAVWGYNFLISLTVANCAFRGINTECFDNGGQIIGRHSNHSINDSYIAWCGFEGVRYAGPHDGKHRGVYVEQCYQKAPGTGAGVLIETISGVCDGNSEWTGCHSWCVDLYPSHAFSWEVRGAQAKFYGCQADQFKIAGVFASRGSLTNHLPTVEWYDGPIYGTPQSSEDVGDPEQFAVAFQLDGCAAAMLRPRIFALGGPMIRFLNSWQQVNANIIFNGTGLDFDITDENRIYAGVANVDLSGCEFSALVGGQGALAVTPSQLPLHRINYSPAGIGFWNPLTGEPYGRTVGAMGAMWTNQGGGAVWWGTHWKGDSFEVSTNGMLLSDTTVALDDKTKGASLLQVHAGGLRKGAAPADPSGVSTITWTPL